MLEVSRGGGNTARGIYLLVEYTARECPMLVVSCQDPVLRTRASWIFPRLIHLRTPTVTDGSVC